METITILENNQKLILEVLDTFLYKGVQYIIYQDNEEILVNSYIDEKLGEAPQEVYEIAVKRLEDVING
ncbi:MAG TPA: hypothetical protein DHU33_02440 [Firmicutes bacterium]|nr:hypothetical protein [Bacillota bacterium]